MATVHARLARLIEVYWRVPRAEGKVLLSVLRKSSCARVKQLRSHLALLDIVVPTVPGAREPDAQHLFAEVLTPAFVVQLVADLRSAGQLTAAQVRTIEPAMLACVDRQGQWRAIEE